MTSTRDTLEERSRPENVEFAFEHRVFGVEGGVFRKAADGRDIVFLVPLGSVTAAIALEKLQATFGIANGSKDAQVLGLVVEALKYVREIRPGDSIPTEIIDGRASWMVDETYLQSAKARISLQLVAWLRGSELGNLDAHEVIARAEHPETRNMIQQAFATIAEKLGYASEDRQQVVHLIDRLAGELSYIEALRDRFNAIRRILAGLKTLNSAYRRDRNVAEMIMRCTALLTKPAEEIFGIFETLDGNTGEVIATLKRFDRQVAYIRATRDELRSSYLLWEELLKRWESVKLVIGSSAEEAIRETYRFAARNFSVARSWAEL